jgi:hypothetical protein
VEISVTLFFILVYRKIMVYKYHLYGDVTASAGELCHLLRIDYNPTTPEEQRRVIAVVRVAMHMYMVEEYPV